MSSKGRPYRTLDVDGFTVLVGKNDADNDRLTFEVAEPEDIWMHVSGYSGSHVVVRNPDKVAIRGRCWSAPRSCRVVLEGARRRQGRGPRLPRGDVSKAEGLRGGQGDARALEPPRASTRRARRPRRPGE